MISFFKSPEGIKRLNKALNDNPDLLVQYASLFEKSLGHEVVVDGAFRSIEEKWLIDDVSKASEDGEDDESSWLKE